MTFLEPIKVSCVQMWEVLNWGVSGLKNPEALSPDQFLLVIRKVVEALMIYYVKLQVFLVILKN